MIPYVITMLILCTGLLMYMNFYTKVNGLLKTFITISFVMWYILPITLTISGVEILSFLRIDDKLYYNIVFQELLFYFSIYGLFLIIFRNKKINFTRFRVKKLTYFRRIDKIFFWVSIVFMGLYIAFLYKNSLDYKENNSIENAEGGIIQIFSFFGGFLISFFWIYYIFGPKGVKRNIVMIELLILSLVMILGGSRIYLLGIIYLLYFIYAREQNKAKKLRVLVIVVTTIVLAIISLPYLSMIRTGPKAESVDDSKVQELALKELNVKLNSFAYSAMLLKYDGEGFAGFNPYIGSLVKFVPRVIWNDKPTATSFNSKVTGMPARRVPYLMGDTTDTFNTGVAPYTVAVWQKGIITVMLSVFLNLLLLFFINRCFNHYSMYVKALGFMMTWFPQLIMFPTYGDNIIQLAEQMILFFVVLNLLGIIKLEYKRKI